MTDRIGKSNIDGDIKHTIEFTMPFKHLDLSRVLARVESRKGPRTTVSVYISEDALRKLKKLLGGSKAVSPVVEELIVALLEQTEAKNGA